MIEFFDGWRRKVGSVALVMACVVMGLWFRSEVVPDFVRIPFEIKICGKELRGLASEKGLLVVYVEGQVKHLWDAADPEIDSPIDSDSTAPEGAISEQPLESENPPSRKDVAESIVEWLQTEQLRIARPVAVNYSRPQMAWYLTQSEPITPIEPVRSHDTYITCYFPEPEPLLALHLGWIVLPLTLFSAYFLLVPTRKLSATSHVSA